MAFDCGAKLRDRGSLRIPYEQHAMRVAHRERHGRLQRRLVKSRNRKREAFGIHSLRHGDFAPVQARRAHIDHYALLARGLAEQRTAGRLQGDVIALSFGHQQIGDAARGIAAGLHFAAIGVEDAHEGGGPVFRRLHHDHLIAADPALPVGDGFGHDGVHQQREDSRIEDDEIIAQTVHFQEAGHGGLIRPWPSAC